MQAGSHPSIPGWQVERDAKDLGQLLLPVQSTDEVRQMVRRGTRKKGGGTYDRTTCRPRSGDSGD